MPITPAPQPTHVFRRVHSDGVETCAYFDGSDWSAGALKTVMQFTGTSVQVEGKTEPGTWWAKQSAVINERDQIVEVRRIDGADWTPVAAGKVRRLFLFIGQSNCSGRGTVDPGISPYPQNGARVWLWSREFQWVSPPVEPVDADGSYPVDATLNGDGAAGYGPAVAFAHYMSALTDDEIGIVVCPKGGTTADEWLPDHLGVTTRGNCFGAAVAAVRHALRLEGSQLDAVVVLQGESDGINDPPVWDTHWNVTLPALRTELDAAGLTAVIIRLWETGPPASYPGWEAVRTQQAGMAGADTLVVDATDGPWTDGTRVHIETAAQLGIGQSLATALAAALL